MVGRLSRGTPKPAQGAGAAIGVRCVRDIHVSIATCVVATVVVILLVRPSQCVDGREADQSECDDKSQGAEQFSHRTSPLGDFPRGRGACNARRCCHGLKYGRVTAGVAYETPAYTRPTAFQCSASRRGLQASNNVCCTYHFFDFIPCRPTSLKLNGDDRAIRGWRPVQREGWATSQPWATRSINENLPYARRKELYMRKATAQWPT